MQDLEKGKLKWGDEAKIQEMRVLFIHRLTRENQAPIAQGPTTKTTQLFCLNYQDGSCAYNADHNSARGSLKHMCAFCYKITGHAYPHREIDCKRKSRQQSKNDRTQPADKPT